MLTSHREKIKELLLYAAIIGCTLLVSSIFFKPKAIETVGVRTVKLDDYGIENLGPIVLYSSKECGACSKLKEYLKVNNIKYHNYQLETSPSKFKQLHENGIGVVPVLFIKSDMIVGYSQIETEKLLRASGFL